MTKLLTHLFAIAITALPAAAQVVRTVIQNGPSSELYDMVFLGDGYTAADQAQFDRDVLDVVNYFRNTPNKYPYGAYFHLYNVHTVFRASNQRGADQPPNNIFVDTAYDASYWTGGTERCLYIGDTALAAADAALAPDTDGRVIVLVNDPKYGGCAGAFSVSYNGTSMEEVQCHEWGHSFAGLADEYDYGSPGTYTGAEPGQPNISADPTGARKWAAWLGHAGPNGTVGAYQGAGYYQLGLYRPEPDCEMRTLSRSFCTICREQMIKRFHQECEMFGAPTPSPIAAQRGGNVVLAFTNRLATRQHRIEWRVDGGAWTPGTASFTWAVGNAAPGSHTIEARLTDTTTDVRQDPNGLLVHVHAWRIDVAATRLDLGIADVVPAAQADVEGDTDSVYPWNHGGAARALYAFGAAAARSRNAVHVRGIAFRPDATVASLNAATWDLALDVSTGRFAPDALDRTFDANHGADRVRVFDGAVAIGAQALSGSPRAFEIVVGFDEPFAWNPSSGPLLLDFRLRGLVAGTGVLTDAATATDGSFGRILHTSDANATSANFPATGVQPVGLVAELLLDPDVSPVGSAINEGLGSSSVGLGYAGPQRLMTIHDGATFELPVRQRITELAWRTDSGAAWPAGRAIDLRVELSTGAPAFAATASQFFESNHGADRTVVFDGVWTPPATSGGGLAPFALRLPLDRPFDFDPAHAALVVDLQIRGIGGGAVPPMDGSAAVAPGLRTLWQFGAPNAGYALLTTPNAPILATIGVPTPVLPEGADGVPGGISLSRPWGVAGSSRSMTAYAPSTLGVALPIEITHLAWRSANGGPTPPMTWNARIDLSSGGALPLGANLDANHGADRATVFDGAFSATRAQDGSFAFEVKLDTPFRWDPTNGALIVDIRKFGELGGTGGFTLDAANSSAMSFAANTADANATVADRPVAARGQVLRLGGRVGANALVTPYGSGCPGVGGIPVASSLGLPWLGNREFAFALYDARPLASASLLIGIQATNTPLAPFGAPGCTLLTDVALAIVTMPTDASGFARSPTAVANDPSLAGAFAHAQWVVLDPAGSGGLALSGGTRIELR